MLRSDGSATSGSGLITDSSGSQLVAPGQGGILGGDIGPLNDMNGNGVPGSAYVGADGKTYIVGGGLKLPQDANSIAKMKAQNDKYASDLAAFDSATQKGREAEANLPVQGPVFPGATGDRTDAGIQSSVPVADRISGVSGSVPDFNVETKTSVPGSDFEAALAGGEGMNKFYTDQFGNVQTLQQEVIDVRAAQNTNVKDLEDSRLKEGMDQARADLEAARQERLKLESDINRIEDDVAREMGGGGTGSQMRAEVNNRLRQIKPAYEDALAREQSAIDKLNITNTFVSQRFNALRADAKEAVDRSFQKLGFATDNINTAFTMMNNMQSYSLNNDKIITEKQTQARADFAAYNSVPGGLKSLTEMQRADLAKRAGLSPDFVSYVSDLAIAPTFQAVDPVTGDYVSVFREPRTNAISFDTVKDVFADTPSAVTSASLQRAGQLDQASPQFQSAWKDAVTNMKDIALKFKNKPTEFGLALDAQIARLGQSVDTTVYADKVQYEAFKKAYVVQGATSLDLVAAGNLGAE